MKDLDQELVKSGVGKLKVPWHTKLLLKLRPKLYMRLAARRMGIKNPVFDQAHDLFSKSERIDLFPRGGSDGRSITMVIDRKTALFFYQDGDHFKYDGFEMGEYGKGEVTVFDQIKNVPGPYA